MILEIAGSRVLSPHLGTSFVVWTSLIGIVLGSLSIGYWWGGRLADRKASCRTLSAIIMAAAVSVGILPVVRSAIFGLLEGRISNVYIGSAVASVLLFTGPSVLLGMVSPYAVKLKMKDLKRSGATVGSLYAISTVGSISGTFLAGFVLIAYLGLTNLLLALAIVLGLTSLLASYRDITVTKSVIVLSLGLSVFLFNSYDRFLKKQDIIEVDTAYNRVLIYTMVQDTTGRPIRLMVTNPREAQSAMYLDRDDELVLDYTKFYRLVRQFKPDIRHALMLGGAGYSYPKDFLKRFADARMDVVEIDPGVTDLARKYFRLSDDPRLAIFHEDGRTFLNRTESRYDVVFSDAFNSLYSLPYQLTTRESAMRMRDVLADDGVVFVNVISGIEGDKGKFLRAFYATLSEVFPRVYLFQVHAGTPPDEVQNLMLVAFKDTTPPSFQSSDPELHRYLGQRWTRRIPLDMPVLTDDHAPVDNYMLSVITSAK